MNPMTLNISGMGIVTDTIRHVNELIPSSQKNLAPAEQLDPATVSNQDALTQLALRAIHQAWTMASLATIDGERIALIVQSSWGNIDSTAAYLESMFAADGRYASPRHFSRSVYSSVTSVAAIHFHIQGPCETLAFDEAPLLGALRQAWRLLCTHRANRVVIVWCEQAGDLAADLAKKAAEQLHRRDFQRYVDQGLGFGAVALVVGLQPGPISLDLDHWNEDTFAPRPTDGKPFAMDTAVTLLRSLFIK